MEKENILKDLYSNLQVKHEFILGPIDTDSVSIGKPDGSPFSKEEQENLLNEINALLPKYIQYAHDGYFHRIVAVRAKNYILLDEKGKLKIRGSALRSSKTEKGLKEFLERVIDCLVYDKQDQLLSIYQTYVKEAFNVRDISRWVSKKTVTQSVLNPERTNEQKVLDALKGRYLQMGNKVFTYFTADGSLKLQEDWTNDHDPEVLLKKIYNTLAIFENVIDMTQFKKYHLKNHDIRCELHEILGIDPPVKVKKSKKSLTEDKE